MRADEERQSMAWAGFSRRVFGWNTRNPDQPPELWPGPVPKTSTDRAVIDDCGEMQQFGTGIAGVSCDPHNPDLRKLEWVPLPGTEITRCLWWR
jgi:hypothetical protein